MPCVGAGSGPGAGVGFGSGVGVTVVVGTVVVGTDSVVVGGFVVGAGVVEVGVVSVIVEGEGSGLGGRERVGVDEGKTTVSSEGTFGLFNESRTMGIIMGFSVVTPCSPAKKG